MKQIKNKKELIGKTISQIIMPKEHYDDLWIKFTDNSFVVFKVDDISAGFEFSKYVMIMETSTMDMTESEFVELELITPEIHQNAINEQEKRWSDQNEEREKNEKISIEKYEKDQLEKLKLKYK